MPVRRRPLRGLFFVCASGAGRAAAKHEDREGTRPRQNLRRTSAPPGSPSENGPPPYINLTWTTGQIPSPRRRAVIIPIPKASKGTKLTTSHRPIALTSHLAKLAERLVAASLTSLAERDGLVPPEQVGFRRGRSAEENLTRLVQLPGRLE